MSIVRKISAMTLAAVIALSMMPVVNTQQGATSSATVIRWNDNSRTDTDCVKFATIRQSGGR